MLYTSLFTELIFIQICRKEAIQWKDEYFLALDTITMITDVNLIQNLIRYNKWVYICMRMHTHKPVYVRMYVCI